MVKLLFETQVATLEEQSGQLLALGLKPETADCYIDIDGRIIVARDENELSVAINTRKLTPSWSFNRLMILMPIFLDKNKIDESFNVISLDFAPTFVSYRGYNRKKGRDMILKSYSGINQYEITIDMIAWLIVNRYFDKKFLNRNNYENYNSE